MSATMSNANKDELTRRRYASQGSQPTGRLHFDSQVADPHTETSSLLPLQLPVAPKGSTIPGCVFNFCNGIIGAGCIGLGGAIASSGGLVSVICILLFAYLSKLSFDMLIELDEQSSYENLAFTAYGPWGSWAVLVSKFLYAYGCLVAYIKIVKDNFTSGLEGMTGLHGWKENIITLVVGATIMFPLCLLRDLTPLEKVSIVKILIVMCILVTVIALYPSNHQENGSAGQQWLEVRPGLFRSLGTFVFTFVAQHVVHLAYESLQPELRTIANWKTVSFYSIMVSLIISLGVGITVYVTFWDGATSDIFGLYPPSIPLSISKLLLSFMMMFTYPLPFLTCRELVIVSLPAPDDQGTSWWMLGTKQLIAPLHLFLTFSLWSTSTILAILAPSLGDVLNLTGCATGTLIAYILPSLFSFRLKGYTHKAAALCIIGGVVGILGTAQSLQKLLSGTTT
jgi:amino acid permease